jgi:hypothetical protein
MYEIGDKCYSVGDGVFSPIGTFAMLAATFFAAIAIDWVRARLHPIPSFSVWFILAIFEIVSQD